MDNIIGSICNMDNIGNMDNLDTMLHGGNSCEVLSAPYRRAHATCNVQHAMPRANTHTHATHQMTRCNMAHSVRSWRNCSFGKSVRAIYRLQLFAND